MWRRLDAPGHGFRHIVPLGPGLVTDWDFRDKTLRTYVNGTVVQHGSTDEMTWDIDYLVADIARNITLVPALRPIRARVSRGRGRGRGAGHADNTIVTGPTAIRADVGAQPTESEEVRRPPRVATGRSAAPSPSAGLIDYAE